MKTALLSSFKKSTVSMNNNDMKCNKAKPLPFKGKGQLYYGQLDDQWGRLDLVEA